MNRPATPVVPELRAAVAAESDAASVLADALAHLRRRTETRDGDGLEPAVGAVQKATAAMARAGAERMRHTLAAARALGLEGDPPLARVAEQLGGDLAAASEGLARRLRGLARESASLGICTRFGANACERLLALQRAAFGLHDGYGSDGRLGGRVQGLGRRA